MPRNLLKCQNCGAYTMTPGTCHYCHEGEVHRADPPKFSVDDKYAKYRREMKRRIQNQKQNS